MLVRVLQADGANAAKPLFMETDAVPNPPNPDLKISKLSIIAKSPAPRFKVLLFPHLAGAEIPVTKFNQEGTKLGIQWSDQTDILTFETQRGGYTQITLARRVP